MKKIILSIAFMAFIFSINAQVGIKPTDEKIPNTPKNKAKDIMPQDLATPIQKAYEDGKVAYWGYTYLSYLMANYTSFFVNDNRTTLTMVPDTCLRIYTDNEDAGSGWVFGLGASFDPYSESFDPNFEKGLFNNPKNYFYAYKLDTLMLRTIYINGKGYNPNSPDTLRLYVASYPVYTKVGAGTDFYTVRFDQSSDSSYLAPIIKVTSMGNPKGGAIEPVINNTRIIDYVLTEEDFSDDTLTDGRTSHFYKNTVIPLTYNGVTQNGFEVPYGNVLFTMFKFVPGFDYEMGDTLYHGLTDPLNPGYYDAGYPIYTSNVFRIAVFNSESDYKTFADPFGYNCGYLENIKLHYQLYEDPGEGYINNNTIFYPMYGGGINLLPEIAFFMSVDSALGDTIDVNVVEANDIVSNIYPNPSKDQLFVELKNEGKASIQLFNILGQEVKNISTLDNKTQVNVSDLKAGIYIVRVKQNNKVFTSKITIQ